MCRGTSFCTELGTDPSRWSTKSPLRPKDWFLDAFDAFRLAQQAADNGQVKEAIALLDSTRERELNEWFDVHAQNSGRFRSMHYGSEPRLNRVVKDPVKSIKAFEKALMDRDGHLCQYCGIPVITSAEFSRFRDQIGVSNFPTVGSNKQRHGVKLVFSGTLDHVDPYSRGGRTSPENLVTCCWPCNYGKAEYTVKELGIKDPRDK